MDGLAYMAGRQFIIETSLVNASVSDSTSDRARDASEIKTWNAGLSAGLTGNFAVRYVLR